MWLRIFYVRILHDFCNECICQHFWALSCCFWLYFAFYVTYGCFEVLLIVQRVLRHTISTSKAWYLHTYTDLHTHQHIQIYSCIHVYQYYILPSTHPPTHLPLYGYVHTNIYLPIQTHVSINTTHTYCFTYIHAHLYTNILLLIVVLPVLLPTTISPSTITDYHHLLYYRRYLPLRLHITT